MRNAQYAMRSGPHTPNTQYASAIRNAQWASLTECAVRIRNTQCAVGAQPAPDRYADTQCAMRSCAHQTPPIRQYAIRNVQSTSDILTDTLIHNTQCAGTLSRPRRVAAVTQYTTRNAQWRSLRWCLDTQVVFGYATFNTERKPYFSALRPRGRFYHTCMRTVTDIGSSDPGGQSSCRLSLPSSSPPALSRARP